MITLAILGSDDDVLAAARTIVGDARFHVVGIFDVAGGPLRRLQAVLPGVPVQTQWESLLASSPQVVLVGRERSADQADDQLRKLVQAAVPLVLTHPACEAILALELEMIQRDSAAPLTVSYPGCRHPARERLTALVQASDESGLGRIEQVLVERYRNDRSATEVMTQLARDVHWLQPIVGDVRQVSALAAARNPQEMANLSVQMLADAGTLVRWSIHPAADGMSAEITVVGTGRQARLRMPLDSGDCELSIGSDLESLATTDPGQETLDVIASLAESVANQNSVPAKSVVWSAVSRSLEVVDAVTVSLKRGRTVELQKTLVSEESTFKGMMSAAGCLLLLIAPLVLIVGAVIDRLQASFHPRPVTSVQAGSGDAPKTPDDGSNAGSDVDSSGGPASNIRPRKFPLLALLLATPLIAFLLLQFLQLVFQRGTPTPTTAERESSRPSPLG